MFIFIIISSFHEAEGTGHDWKPPLPIVMQESEDEWGRIKSYIPVSSQPLIVLHKVTVDEAKIFAASLPEATHFLYAHAKVITAMTRDTVYGYEQGDAIFYAGEPNVRFMFNGDFVSTFVKIDIE